MGKHVDKLPWDEAEDIRTLPVILGETRARKATQGLMAAFYVTVAIDVAIGALPWPALLAILGLPAAVQAWRALSQPKPSSPPADFPIWPLWFAAFAFLHTRRAGALLVLGLVVAAVFDITPF
jgi:1,4-dihydroxy-2-naphthoate octaprenyltransferase